jgi:adenosyl cobinamide kinase/adenosyl cobinamide phosphate guanylyltransferase
MNQLSRQFIDLAGDLHQRMATVSDRVILMVAGLPMVLKGKL